MSAASEIKRRIARYGPLAVVFALHMILQRPHLSLDFWNDELHTLQHYVLVPALRAATDYRVPNNHVFFSLITQAWAGIAGIKTMQQAIVQPMLLRLLPFAFSLLAVWQVYRIGALLSGRMAGCLGAIVLVTSIPFYNYAAQMRGYGLSMALYAALAVWVIQAARGGQSRHYVCIALCACLLLYTLPSNLYYIIAAGVSAAVGNLVLRKEAGIFPLRNMLKIQAALGAGVIIAALLYLPLVKDMSALPVFKSSRTAPAAQALRFSMPVVAYHFLSARYLLLLALPAAFFIQRKKRPEGYGWTVMLTAAIVFLLPFLCCDLRRNETPQRVFLTALPVLAAAAGLALSSAISWIRSGRIQSVAALLIAACFVLTCIFQIRKADAKALRDIAAGERCGDLYFQYNLHHYHPRADAETYLVHYYRPTIPVVEACRMDAELLKYLRLAGWQEPFCRMEACPVVYALPERTAARRVPTGGNASHDGQLVSGDNLHPATPWMADTEDVLTEVPGRMADTLKGWTSTQLLPGQRSVQIVRFIRKPPLH